MKELFQKIGTLGRVIQILEHFETDKEWTLLLKKKYQKLLREEPPKKSDGIMFLEVDSGKSSTTLFNSLKERELMTRDQTMMLLSISSATLSRWQGDGTLQAYSIKGRVYFKFSEVIDSLIELK